MPGQRQSRQASKEFGIKLAKALVLHARTEAPAAGLDSQTAIVGAADYLTKYTVASREQLIDTSDVDPDKRAN